MAVDQWVSMVGSTLNTFDLKIDYLKPDQHLSSPQRSLYISIVLVGRICFKVKFFLSLKIIPFILIT